MLRLIVDVGFRGWFWPFRLSNLVLTYGNFTLNSRAILSKEAQKASSPWRVDSCVSVGLDPDNRFMVNKILPEILTVFCNPLGVDFDFNPERIWRQYHPTASGRSTTLHIHEKAGSWIFDTAWRYRRNRLAWLHLQGCELRLLVIGISVAICGMSTCKV